MSIIDREITNTEVIPIVQSSIFEGRPDLRFAVGILAVGDQVVPGLENEYAGYFDLRRKVYVNQTGQLNASELNEDGTDRDPDDARSVAFGIVENHGTDQRIVASTRLIIKGFADDAEAQKPLPVEEFCPELFADKPVPTGGLEVSRLIARHEKASVQEILRWRIYAAALGYIANHDLGPTYAVVEPWLESHLKSTIPVSKIGEARYIDHYQDYNLPIEVHTDEFVGQMDRTHPGMMQEMFDNEGTMTYFGKVPHQRSLPASQERRHRNEPVESERRSPLISAIG